MAETTARNFNAAGFNALVKQWDKCIDVGGWYVEKKYFVQVPHITYFALCIH
jgi:hypothetical protein